MTLTIQLPPHLLPSLRDLTEEKKLERLEPVVRAAVEAAFQAAMQAEASVVADTTPAPAPSLSSDTDSAAPPLFDRARLRAILHAARQAA